METHQQVHENEAQCTFCRGERDPSVWGLKNSENHDRNVQRCHNCQVFKSGHLYISSKGIGWTSWKRRWFILTSTSLFFLRSDPNSSYQRGEVNLMLGVFDLNNSGSVVTRADKKLLTVLFPDGRDGRAFTLKADTLGDMNDWKTALESVLAQAPSAALAMGQTEIFRSDAMETIEASLDQCRDKRTQKPMIIGRPILLALEEIDGSPSFLEKSLRFIEQHGIRVEGILRQSADVEEVDHRIQRYEKGNNEFDANEDAHVIGDCIKFVLRELPSSPVPVSSCIALVDALRADRRTRISSMRTVISSVLPEPNRRLLQRILRMMRIVASHRSENRMAISAVAACMAPLLLRPLLAGECELEDGMDIGGDGSMQLLKAAAAANHAQAIIIILLEAYEEIFDDDAFSSELCTDSEECYSDNDEDDDDEYDEEDEDNDDGDEEDEDNNVGDDDDGDESTDGEIMEDEGYHDAQNEIGQLAEEDLGITSSGFLDESGIDLCHIKVVADRDSTETPKLRNDSITIHQLHQSHDSLSSQERPTTSPNENSQKQLEDSFPFTIQESDSGITTSCIDKLSEISNASGSRVRPPNHWGRTSARKNLSMESIDYSVEDDVVIQRLEITKSELQAKIMKEEQENKTLQANIEKRKGTLHEHRIALEEDVKKLQEQLRREKDLRACLEAGLMNMRPGHLSLSPQMDYKNVQGDLKEIAMAEADVIHLKQKVSDLRGQLSHHGQKLCPACGQLLKEQSKSKWVNTLTSVHHHRNTCAGDMAESIREHHPVDLLGGPLAETQGVAAEAESASNDMHSESKSLDEREEVRESTREKLMPEKQQKDHSGLPRKAHSKAETLENYNSSSGSTTSASPSLSSLLLSSSTVTTLSRLTHRLNFLKERRAQLPNELQQADPGPTQKLETPDRRANAR